MINSRILISFFFLLFINKELFAHDPNDTSKKGDIKNTFESYRSNSELQNEGFESQRLQELSDAKFETEQAREIASRQEFEDLSFQIQHRWRSFDFQFVTSIIIFVLVVLVVLCGLFFSAWQFQIALKQLKIKEAITETVTQAACASKDSEKQDILFGLRSELEISPSSIKINSSILGVIILIISIAFLYLYLIFVYPIRYLPSSPDTIQTIDHSARPVNPEP